MLLPGRVQIYRQTLESTEQAYKKIETIIGELGQDFRQQQVRLDEGVRRYGEE